MSVSVVINPILLFIMFMIGSAWSYAYGVRAAILPLLYVLISALGFELVEVTIANSNAIADVLSIIFGIGTGVYIAFSIKKKAIPKYIKYMRMRTIDLLEDTRIQVLCWSMALGLLATAVFGHLSKADHDHRFWHGFYEAWTASIVFFGVLGITGLVVTFYKPELEGFDVRVRILCGGRQGSEVDYIKDQVRKIGYFAEHVERKISIEHYDEERKAFRIETVMSSRNRNFYGDTSEDIMSLKLTPDKIDPPLHVGSSLGKVVSVTIGGKKMFGPCPFDIEGFMNAWPVKFTKSDPTEIEVIHEMFASEAEVHTLRSARFAKAIVIQFTYNDDFKPPKIRYRFFSFQKVAEGGSSTPNIMTETVVQMEPGKPIFLPKIDNVPPDQVFFSYQFEPRETTISTVSNA